MVRGREVKAEGGRDTAWTGPWKEAERQEQPHRDSQVPLTLCWSWLRGIDSRDYRRRRIPHHRFICPALRLHNGGRPGTCEPHPSPLGQVECCNPVPVHYDSTFSTPELTSQSLVGLKSLPASQTRHAGTSCLISG